ncbi:hypothetical protein R3P38DRAFT_3289445 [Favolaschia claudopus]|uniref:MYND-type domain-containing protein n=1 Tax=Favolaschia claudopus TaxID=2862362 RepID=A0AAV9ZUM0_9AGAR
MMCFIDGSVESEDRTDRKLCRVLLSKGIIETITKAIHALSRNTACGEPVRLLLHAFFVGLLSLFSFVPRQKWIAQAIRAGLLPAIIHSGKKELIESTREALHDLLINVLPAAMVYHSVLSAFRDSLIQINGLDVTVTMSDEDHVAKWQDLLRIVNSRLTVVEKYNTKELGAILPCDNLKCNKLVRKEDLRRCHNCLSVFYCSRPCQRSDWQASHRHGCADLFETRRRHQSTSTSTRDRSFFRALIHNEYVSRREEIAMKELAFMQEYDADTPYYISFDFPNGTCDISIWALDTLTWSDDEDDGETESDSQFTGSDSDNASEMQDNEDMNYSPSTSEFWYEVSRVVFFRPWLGLKAVALAFKNTKPGQTALAWLHWLWLGFGKSQGFWRGFVQFFGFGLTKFQAGPKPALAKARKSQGRAKKPWLFGLRPKPEKH